MKRVGVVGAGAWGTALAITVKRAGCEVTLWAREPEVVESINQRHENTLFLPGIELSPPIHATNDLQAIREQEVLFLVAPAQYVRATCEQLSEVGLAAAIPLVICSKGIEREGAKLMSEVVEEILPNTQAILTGPTFAHEVAKGLPASVTLACNDATLGKQLARTVESPGFRIHHSHDVIGSQIGGAVKNVIAIACGIIEGKELGEGTKAALIVKGLAEIRQLCVAKGGSPETVLEPCCAGDLILTCNSRTSRNMSLGYALGRGETLDQILEKRISVAEGVASSDAVTTLADQLGIRLPTCEGIHQILGGTVDTDKVILELVQN